MTNLLDKSMTRRWRGKKYILWIRREILLSETIRYISSSSPKRFKAMFSFSYFTSRRLKHKHLEQIRLQQQQQIDIKRP